MSTSPIDTIERMLFHPTSFRKKPLEKALLVFLDVLFGVATIGLVHLGFGIKHLFSDKTGKKDKVATVFEKAKKPLESLEDPDKAIVKTSSQAKSEQAIADLQKQIHATVEKIREQKKSPTKNDLKILKNLLVLSTKLLQALSSTTTPKEDSVLSHLLDDQKLAREQIKELEKH